MTNKTESAKTIVLFHNGRGSQEAIFGNAKNDTALSVIPCKRLVANQVFTLSSMMAYNFSQEMQMIAHLHPAEQNQSAPRHGDFKNWIRFGIGSFREPVALPDRAVSSH